MLLTLLLAAAPAAPAPAAEPEDHEPALGMYFEVEGGKRVPVEVGKPFNPGELGRSATLRLEPERRFAFAGLEFRYPREFGFEAELQGQLTTWTLSGNDAKLMVHRYRGQKKVDALLKSVVTGMHGAYGGKAKESPATLTAGGRTFEGTRLEVSLAGSTIVQDVFGFRSGNDAVVLIIQDSPKKAGEPSPERVRAEGLLRDSLKLPPAK